MISDETEEFFSLKEDAFGKGIPADAMYTTHAMEETLGRLYYTADKQLFTVLTATPGCGKSTLIRRFAESLDKDRYLLLYLSDSELTPRLMYKGILNSLGVESRFYRGDSRRQLIREVEIIREVEHKKIVCVLDEAHLLKKETLEEIRFALNYRFDSMNPLALVLVGQPELWFEKLKLRQYAAVRQRIDMYCSLPPLSRAETGEYVRSRLEYAGNANEIFTDGALDVIFKSTSGIMREINHLCSNCLIYACQQKKHLIDDHMVRFVISHEAPSPDGITTVKEADA